MQNEANQDRPKHLSADLKAALPPPDYPPVMKSLPMIRIGCVSYLNAKPLIYGLNSAENIRLTLDIPAKLIDGLRSSAFDVALLPIIDVQRLGNVRIITSGGIGCDGPTLTVRIFSKVPVEQIEVLACDTHSHSSVALARVLLAEAHDRWPDFVEFDHEHPSGKPQAILLIGDKVVCEEPVGYPYQVDLGEAWKKLTGLPFVFAAWVARGGVELGDLPSQLKLAKELGMAHLPEIVEREAIPRGWPAELAMRYMTEYLKYDIGPRQLQAIRLFHELAAKHGMLAKPVRELDVI
jgi:chorismate dehydratase